MIQKHKILVFFISLLAAVIFWLFVVTTVAPDTVGTVNGISLTVIGDTTLEARGLMIASLDNESVWVELQTSRATLSKLNSGNMSATLDVSRITEAGDYDLSYSVYYPDTVNTGDIQLLRKSTDKVHVSVCNIASKTLQLEPQWSGQLQDGYLIVDAEVSYDPEVIRVQGPEAEINQIARVITTYDVSDLTESVTLQVQPIFLDELGNELTLSELVTVSNSTVNMNVPVSLFKDVQLTVSLIYGAGVNETNASVKIEPESIRVRGNAEVIEAMDDILNLGEVDLIAADNGDKVTLPLTLPKGIKSISGESSATVTVQFKGISYRNFTVNDIKLINESEEYPVELVTREITVRLRGSKTVLDAIDPEQIHVIADLKDISQSGTQTVKATVTIDGDPDFGIEGVVELIITVS